MKLLGPKLDAAVCKVLNLQYRYIDGCGGEYNGARWWATRNYSSDIVLGIRLLEKERISLSPIRTGWSATCKRNNVLFCEQGETMLIAGMRCFVASHLEK